MLLTSPASFSILLTGFPRERAKDSFLGGGKGGASSSDSSSLTSVSSF